MEASVGSQLIRGHARTPVSQLACQAQTLAGGGLVHPAREDGQVAGEMLAKEAAGVALHAVLCGAGRDLEMIVPNLQFLPLRHRRPVRGDRRIDCAADHRAIVALPHHRVR